MVAAPRVEMDRQNFDRATAGDLWRVGGHVFTIRVGTAINASDIEKRLRTLLTEAGRSRQRIHDLRLGAASLRLAGGPAPGIIMVVLGHSQISPTMSTYAHLPPALERVANRALDAVLNVAEMR